MKTSFQHLVLGIFLQGTLAFCWPPVAKINQELLAVAALGVICLFYGREHSQEERKVADSLKCKHAELWSKYPKEAYKVLWPGNWAIGNLMDFLFPVVAVCIITAIAWIV